ncbi:phosphatidylglycerophosphatase A and related protein [Serpentinimonas raichei]|uniref:Phosphatidylglycerophosphatase A n=1 Tax=Serpentinimonas raichei TaxID=1458425 RepID=A0A060NSP8_9BURK|nr:phosphatidylglycerophosphatase A [Serpentinimonas raichei]BAO81914.1 phosphatidylglycerophosphatase A and related protein [Serpentinimonas raichei]
MSPESTSASASAPKAARQPGLRFLLAHPAHTLALGFGAGLSPRAPGTIGTLWAWAVFVWVSLLWQPSAWVWGLIIAVTLLLGWWATAITLRHSGASDPGFIVIDEIVAFWLVLWLIAPAGWLGQLLAFALFRYFDAAKPGPVAWADRVFKGQGWRGAWGVMFDDLVAAFCVLLLFALWRFLF